MLKKLIIGIIVGSIVLLSSAGAIYAYQEPENVARNSQSAVTAEESELNERYCYGNFYNAQYVDENNDGICDNCDRVNCQNNGNCNEENAICSRNNESNRYQNQNRYSIRNENRNNFFGGSEEKNQESNINCLNNRAQNGKNK